MNKYRGTYLSLLPPGLLRELDKYEKFIKKNEKFNEYGNIIANFLNKQVGFGALSVKSAEMWNKIFIKYGIDPKFVIDYKFNTINFINNKLLNISDKLLKDMKRMISINKINV